MAGKQNQSPKKNRKSLFARLCVLAFVAYAAVMLVDMQINLAQRKQDLEEINAAVEQKRIDNKELERRIATGIDDEYIEQVARENGYVYPEERVFIDISGS